MAAFEALLTEKRYEQITVQGKAGSRYLAAYQVSKKIVLALFLYQSYNKTSSKM